MATMDKFKAAALAIVIFGSCIASPRLLRAEDLSPSLGGELYWQGIESVSWSDNRSPTSAFGSDTGFSLDFTLRKGNLKAQFSAASSILGGSAADALFLQDTQQGSASLNAFHLGPNGSTPDWAIAFLVQKAYVSWTPGYFFFSAGRQIVNWGKARFFSPADLFCKTAIYGLVPVRIAENTVRTGFTFGDWGKVELVALPVGQLENGKFGGRISGSAFGVDAGIAAAREMGYWQLAMDFKTDAFIGILGECALGFQESNAANRDIKATLGLDYSLGKTLSASGEYHVSYSWVDEAGPYQKLVFSAGFYPADLFGISAAYSTAFPDGANTINIGLSAQIEQGASLLIWTQYSDTKQLTVGGKISWIF